MHTLWKALVTESNFLRRFLFYAQIDMEDAHTQLLSLNNDKNSAFFAVYDGHGGW